ncbi:MAG: glycosyltransferase, partial [Rhodospirillales bacterium]|nr:glycosyltransferase [Rhodospirillales bacterium]
LDRVPLQLYRWERENWWTVGWLPYRIRNAVDRLAPDLVHLHGVGRGAAPIESLAQLAAYPLVWTLRDLWVLTGGCHYTAGCERYLAGCGACPQLGSRSSADLSRWQWTRKQRAWSDIRIAYVGLSQWIADCARRSPLTFGNDVSVIPNGIDTDRFATADRAAGRQAWDLPRGKQIVLFGALHCTTDPRKGFAHFREAIGRLAAGHRLRDAVAVVFGNDGEGPDLGIETRYLGTIRSDDDLARLYGAADVMVVPSTEEGFGKTAAEAMACGTPVVGFDNTGLPDIVDHGQNGYLADRLTGEALARGIDWTLEALARDPSIRHRARAKILRAFGAATVAGRYAELYRRRIALHDSDPQRRAAAISA